MDSLRETVGRAQRSFVVVNAVPFTIGIVLSCFTDVPAVTVHEELTLGLVWGILQGALFVITAWLYERRSTRLSDSIEHTLTSEMLRTPMSGAVPVNGTRW
ncbi:hypothetical protein [Streptomyces chartreusis]